MKAWPLVAGCSRTIFPIPHPRRICGYGQSSVQRERVPSGTGPSTTAGSRCGSLMPSVYSSLPERPIKKLYMKEVVTLNVKSATLGTCDWKAMRPGAIFIAGAGSTPRSHFLASVMLEARSPGETAGKGGGAADSCRYLYHYRRSGLTLLISPSETCRLCAISAASSSSPSRTE